MSETYELDRPIVIDAIRARLGTDCDIIVSRGTKPEHVIPHVVPHDEMMLILAILDAARDVRRQFKPNVGEKLRGEGTQRGQLAAINALVRVVGLELDQVCRPCRT